jgi:hypothetical protein
MLTNQIQTIFDQGRGGVKSLSRGDYEQQGGKVLKVHKNDNFVWLLSQLRPRIRPLVVSARFLLLISLVTKNVCLLAYTFKCMIFEKFYFETNAPWPCIDTLPFLIIFSGHPSSGFRLRYEQQECWIELNSTTIFNIIETQTICSPNFKMDSAAIVNSFTRARQTLFAVVPVRVFLIQGDRWGVYDDKCFGVFKNNAYIAVHCVHVSWKKMLHRTKSIELWRVTVLT